MSPRLDNTEQLGLFTIGVGVALWIVGAILDFEAFIEGITPGLEEFSLVFSAMSATTSIPTTNRGWLFISVILIVVIVAVILMAILEEPFWQENRRFEG